MRKLLICIALTAVCGVLSATSSRATLTEACVFVCCNGAHLKTTPCYVPPKGTTTCGAWLQTNGCP